MSTATAKKKKVDRELLLKLAIEMIRKKGGIEGEVSAKDLSENFDVSPPTIDYHLTKLVEDGRLIATDKRGRYNCRIYRIPDFKNNYPIITNPGDNSEIMRKLLKASQEAIGLPLNLEADQSSRHRTYQPLDVELDSVKESQKQIHQESDQPELPKQQEPERKPDPQPQEDPFVKHMEQREKGLDDYISDFQARSRSLPNAELLLKKDDREIMSVMTESIHQHILYLQDLSQQLSTIEDKSMIQMLIDERNENIKKLQTYENDMKQMREQIDQMRLQNDRKMDLGRVQMSVQNLYSLVDTYERLPSHAQRLGFGDFKKQHTHEVSNLYSYVSQYGK